MVDKQYLTSIGGRKFCLSAEPRESDPNRVKAVLSEQLREDGPFQKINSWKPGLDKPKVPFSVCAIPDFIQEAFEAYKNKIEKREKKLGVADY